MRLAPLLLTALALPGLVFPLPSSLGPALPLTQATQEGFSVDWSRVTDRTWSGPTTWANRLQDWRVRDGRIVCTGRELPYRTLHLTTHRAERRGGDATLSFRAGLAAASTLPPDAAVGVLVGAGALELDYRAACLVQSGPGPDGGVFAGIDGQGRLILRDNTLPEDPDQATTKPDERIAKLLPNGVFLVLDLAALADEGGMQELSLTIADPESGRRIATLRRSFAPERFLGNFALVSHPGSGEDRAQFWFENWRGRGTLISAYPDRTVGPILSAQHTLSRGVLKLTAQLMPIGAEDPRDVALQVRRGESWETVAAGEVDVPGYTARFRVEGWDATAAMPYRVVYPASRANEASFLNGTIRREPVEDEELVLAALSCNHNNRFGFGKPGYPWNDEALWFPHDDLVPRLRQHDPDLLFFAGDQIYEGASPTRTERKNDPYLDYLYKWYLWCWAFGELTADVPCVTIPDDHDVYQGNLWGAGGRPAKRDNEGGYVMPAEWVRMVERTQTSHLPDPYHAGPTSSFGIESYYTSLLYGRVDFAILEDRKFKSGPAGLVQHDGPRPDHINNPDFDPAEADHPQAELLGRAQLRFLENWAVDWRGVDLKAVLSQTVFANVATTHGPRAERLVADLDSNGWPQSGRKRALEALRPCFPLLISGDQHLSTLLRHGVDSWDDGPYSFCVPAIANFYARAWLPDGPGEGHIEGQPEYTGRYRDGLGNLITVFAATNPAPSGREPAALHDLMPGYGIVRFQKSAGTYTVECWPRWADAETDSQYLGWPRTIDLRDNFRFEAQAFLPPIEVRGMERPVIEIRENGSGALVYAHRLRGSELVPDVPAPGFFDVAVGEPGTERWSVRRKVEATAEGSREPLTFTFD